MFARPVAPAVLASITALAFALFNGLLIARGQFDEDAYILFVYVENILNGYGIAYYPGGPRAEGATDFLWMLMLVGLGALGISVGAAAIALNAAGVWLITYLLARELAAAEPIGRAAFWALLPLTVLWVASDPLEAAVGGFSVYLYCALVLLAFVWLYRQIYLDALPLLAITIALYRPDGVIIGVTTVLIGFVLVLRQGRSPRRYLLSSGVALAIGVGYFLWRYRYFGNLLPLPLYVKGAGGGGALAGLGANLGWLDNYRFLLLPLLLAAWGRRHLAALALCALPVIGLFLALLVATQSQNIGYRFQAPLYIVLYYALFVCLIDAFRRPPISRLAGLAYLLVMPSLLQHAAGNAAEAAERTTRHDYVSRFAVQLPCLLPPGSRIVLTEAGKLSYWSSRGGFEVVDLVGLNTEYTARHPLDAATLDGLAPDLFMIWQTGEIPRAGAPRVRQLALADKLSGPSGEGEVRSLGSGRVGTASAVAASYLAEHPDRYAVWLVDWLDNGWYQHVYALRRGLGAEGPFGQALRASVDDPDNLAHFAALRQRDLAGCP